MKLCETDGSCDLCEYSGNCRKEHPELQCGMCLVLGHKCFGCYQERVSDLMKSTALRSCQ